MTSPFLAIGQVETQLKGFLRAVDADTLDVDGRKIIQAIKRFATDARLDIRDYELSETREEQLKNAVKGKKRLEQLRKAILAASEYNVFGPADVAELTARIDQITDHLV